MPKKRSKPMRCGVMALANTYDPDISIFAVASLVSHDPFAIALFEDVDLLLQLDRVLVLDLEHLDGDQLAVALVQRFVHGTVRTGHSKTKTR